jgi:hypothetical protein
MEHYLDMKFYKKIVLIFCFALVLSSCTSSSEKESQNQAGNRFSTLEELKQAFINAGGQCWDWVENEVPAEITKTYATGDCDAKTVLTIYKDGVNVQEYALGFRKFVIDLKFKVNLLVGDNWMINSDQVSTVYPKMGGTLMTR